MEMKRQDQSKPFDAKTAAWVPDPQEGFLQGKIVGTKGDMVTIQLPSGDVSFFFWFLLFVNKDIHGGLGTMHCNRAAHEQQEKK